MQTRIKRTYLLTIDSVYSNLSLSIIEGTLKTSVKYINLIQKGGIVRLREIDNPGRGRLAKVGKRR